MAFLLQLLSAWIMHPTWARVADPRLTMLVSSLLDPSCGRRMLNPKLLVMCVCRSVATSATDCTGSGFVPPSSFTCTGAGGATPPPIATRPPPAALPPPATRPPPTVRPPQPKRCCFRRCSALCALVLSCVRECPVDRLLAASWSSAAAQLHYGGYWTALTCAGGPAAAKAGASAPTPAPAAAAAEAGPAAPAATTAAIAAKGGPTAKSTTAEAPASGHAAAARSRPAAAQGCALAAAAARQPLLVRIRPGVGRGCAGRGGGACVCAVRRCWRLWRCIERLLKAPSAYHQPTIEPRKQLLGS